MVRKTAVSFMLASKKSANPRAEVRNHLRATGVVVRSTKVMITERRDVPVVYAAKKK